MRKKIVAGNWKMNKNLGEGIELLTEIKEVIKKEGVKADKIIIAPSFVHLSRFSDKLEAPLYLAAQDCAFKESGAFTGEVSASMVRSAGAEYVILGHSERREYFKESPEMLQAKVKMALSEELVPIFCCGETFKERENGNHFMTVEEQLEASLFCLEEEDFKNIIVAYEPVWAIGTGLTASPEQAQQMHHHIRSLISSKYGKETADNISILYGGSCNAQNAVELFGQVDIDGGLIGGASLKANDFVKIINAF